MSSHHIVREKQEPALLILGLDNFDDEQLGQLLEWSPTIIATSLIAEKLNAAGIKLDWIVADNAEGDLQSDIKYLPVKNKTEITAALEFLVAQGYPAVNIVADEFELNNYTRFTPVINLVIFYDQQKIYAVHTGFSKWKPMGETISILSPVNDLAITGLEKTGPNIFQTKGDGLFTLTFDVPQIFIAETL